MKRGYQDDSPSSESNHAPKRSNYQTENDVESTKQYHIFGNFFLPHPATINLPDFQRKLALEWEPAFRDFSGRDFSAIQTPVNLDEAYKNFETREKEAWENIGQEPGDNEHLVRPSGSLNSLLAHHLHQPSMETNDLKSGETADYSNGCIRMLMNNGYTKDNLLFDHLHRRSRWSKGLKTFPEDILQCHEDWTHEIYQAMTSPVVLLYGQHVQKRVLHNLNLECTILPLWERAEGQVLVLFNETSFKNADPRYKIRRIGILAYHPQRFFYEKPDSPITQKQDQTFEIVNKMLSNAIPVKEGYYTKKKWLQHNTTTLKAFRQIDLGLQSDPVLSQCLLSLQDERDPDSATQPESAEDSTMIVSSGFTFDQYPHSVMTLKEILPPAIKALKDDEGEWTDFSDLPEEVLKWLRGVKQSIFSEIEIIDLVDISMASVDITKHFGDAKLSPKRAILQLMLAQRDQLKAIPETIAVANADLFMSN